MKQKIRILIGVVLIVTAIGLAVIYWTQLRGIWPAITQPEEDIVQLIESGASTPVEPTTTQERATTTQPRPQIQQGPLRMPAGFVLSIFAKDLGDPRVLAFDPNGVLLASIPAQGSIVALVDTDRDGRSDETKTIIENLDRPHGVIVECAQICKLYAAETDKVLEFSYDPKTLAVSDRRIVAELPGGGGHVTRSLLSYGNNLLVSVGSSCNVCVENDGRRAKILKIAKDSGATETFARGLRNAVFMAFHPFTREIWATEMGRDFLGDNLPPDEINIIKEGGNYGWPICYGKNIHDTEFDKNTYFRNPCMEPFETPSVIDIPAHSAPLGLAFIPDSWPAEYSNDLLVAYHGSWNRSVPTGYKIVRIKLDTDGAYEGMDDFIAGWLTGTQEALGRPVDILFAKDGSAFISDDKAGVVYRLTPPR